MDNSRLNPEQFSAVTHGDGPLLIVAGAGTGKTTVITERIANLINSGLAKPEEILALTFTDKAAGEMEERVDKTLPYGYTSLWIMTFHAFCEKILHDYGLEIGLPNSFKLLPETEQWLLIRKNLSSFNLDYYRPLGNPAKFIHSLIKHFSRCKDELITPADYIEYAQKLELNSDDLFTHKNLSDDESRRSEITRLREVADAYHVYNNLLLENNALDFGDLINYTIKLLQTRPQVLEHFSNQFKYILVDEFQDTNYAQYILVKLLSQKRRNLTVVGDDDQSIYAFRGAAMSNILNFKKDYPESKEIFLTQNYRSGQSILDSAYNFIQLNNPNRLEVQLVQLAEESGKKQHKAKISKTNTTLSKKLLSHADNPGIIEYWYFENLDSEVTGVVQKILELKNQDSETTWNDFVILVRANDSAEPFVQGLNFARIPQIFLANKGLYLKPVILDIVSYLRVLDNYNDSASMYRLLSVPFFKINPDDIVTATHLSKKKNWSLYATVKFLVATADIGDDSKTKINYLVNLIEKHLNLMKEQNVGQIVLDWLEKSGYTKYVSAVDTVEKVDAARYLNQFYNEIRQFERQSADISVRGFLENLNYILESGEEGSLTPDWDEGPEAVKVMTVHAAKGLEFKYVFIVSLVDQRFPSIGRKEAIELPVALIKDILPSGDFHLEEERRLFYVAMTRAKRGLFFTSAADYGGARDKKPSQFLSELGLISSVKNGLEVRANIVGGNKLEPAGIKEKAFPAKGGSVPMAHSLNGGKPRVIKLPKAFSFSQLKDYKTCPYLYYFRYILKIPVAGKPFFSFGDTIHRSLQDFFELAASRLGSTQNSLFAAPEASSENKTIGEAVELTEFLQIYEKNWQDDWYESEWQKKGYKKKGREILATFYEAIKSGTRDNLPFRQEQPFTIRIGKYNIIGRIDRIDKVGNDGVEIIDYKTGQGKEKLEREDKDQLLIYNIAAEELFKLRPKKLTYYFLEDNKQLSFEGDADAVLTLKDNILLAAQEIEKGDFGATPGKHCDWCDFRTICDYRK